MTIVTWGVGVTWALDAAERVGGAGLRRSDRPSDAAAVGSAKPCSRPSARPAARWCSTSAAYRQVRRRSGGPDRARMPSAGWMRLSRASPGSTSRCRSARRWRRSTRPGKAPRGARGAHRVLTVRQVPVREGAARCAGAEIGDPSVKKPFIMSGHEHNEQSPATGDVRQRGLERRRRKRNCTKCHGGARATSRSAPPATFRSIHEGPVASDRPEASR